MTTTGSEGSASQGLAQAPFVGREAELEWLLERVRHAARGRPRACLVRGEPGIGKSRLLAELGRQALVEGFQVWSLRGSPFLQTPYLALDPLLKDLAAICLCGGELEEASEAWWRQLGHGEGPVLPEDAGFGAREQRRLSTAFAQALLERAAHGGFLLLVDDLGWLDGPSLELVWEAMAQAEERGREARACIALVAASRGAAPDTAAARAEARLGLGRIGDVLELAGFDDREVEAWLGSVGLAPPARALAARMQVASGGNPLRLGERLAELRRRALLVRRGRSWVATLDPVAVDVAAGTPPDLPLADEERRVLRTLALFAAPASADRIARLVGVPADEVAACLHRASERGWLRPDGDRFRFEDTDLARALVAELAAEARATLHHEIARMLEASGDGDPELRAHHWLHALPEAPTRRVVEVVHAAGLAALRARDWRRAASHFETALARAPDAEVAERAELHYRAGIAHFRTLDGVTSADHFDRAAELFEKRDDASGVVRARIEGLRARSVLSGAVFGFRPPDLDDLAARIEALAAPEHGLHVYATAMLADSLAMAREPERALEAARRAVAEAEREGDDLRCRANTALGVVQLGRLELEAAVASFRRALRFGRRLGDPWYEALALQRLPLVLGWLGRMDEAASYLLASRKGSEGSGDWADFTLTLGTEAGLANARGDFDAVEQVARQAVSLASRTGYPWGGALALTALATARALRGRVEDALDAVTLLGTPGLLASEVPPEWAAIAGVTRLRVGVLAGRIEPGARERAAGLAKLLLAGPPDVQVLTALCACAEIAVVLDDRASVEQLAGPIEDAAARGIAFVPSLDDALARVRGLIASQRGRPDEALERFQEALELSEQNGARAVEARTHLDCARLLASLGRADEARAHQTRALDLAGALGMAPLVAAAGPDEGVRAEGPAAVGRVLEADEARLLRAMALGYDDAALVSELLLTEEGLARLRERVFARIGATSQVEAAAWAHREGLAELPPPLRRPMAPSEGRAPPLHAATRRVLTVFVSDIAHSTERLQRLGDQRGQQLVQDHNRLVRQLLHAHRGVEIQQTGDGFIAVFDEPARALDCALELQDEMAARALGGAEEPLRLRIGLHSGELLLEEGRVFGVVMHVAAHICSAGTPGAVVVSQPFWDALDDRAAWHSRPLGPAELKGLYEPIELLEIARGVK